MSISKSICVVSMSAAMLFTGTSLAQHDHSAHDHGKIEGSAGQIMHERHENFETIGEAFKTIRDQVRSRDADMQAISRSANTINELAQQLHTWFPAGTGPEAGSTHAKAEIWENKADFNAAAERLVVESGKFVALTRTGDVSKIGGGIRGLGGACKNCHDSYRVDED